MEPLKILDFLGCKIKYFAALQTQNVFAIVKKNKLNLVKKKL